MQGNDQDSVVNKGNENSKQPAKRPATSRNEGAAGRGSFGGDDIEIQLEKEMRGQSAVQSNREQMYMRLPSGVGVIDRRTWSQLGVINIPPLSRVLMIAGNTTFAVVGIDPLTYL